MAPRCVNERCQRAWGPSRFRSESSKVRLTGGSKRHSVRVEIEVAAAGLLGLDARLGRRDRADLLQRALPPIILVADDADLLSVEAGRRRKIGPPSTLLVLPGRRAQRFVRRGHRLLEALLDRLHPAVPVADHAGHVELIGDAAGLAEQVDEQSVVIDALLADQLAAIITMADGAVDGALVSDRAEPVGADPDRRVPGEVEGGRIGAPAQAVGALLGHPDPPRRLADDAAIGQLLDEGALALRRPAVAAGADVDGVEIEDRAALARGGGQLGGRG